MMTMMATRQRFSSTQVWLRAVWRLATAQVSARVLWVLRFGLTASLTALLAACGGSDGNINAPAPAAPAAAVARVEILSTGAWLPGNGETRHLGARAYDASGNAVDAEIAWTSSRPGHVAVDRSGRLTAAVAAGSAQISAQAGGISSASILAFVAAPAPGVTIIDDASIVGEPVETDPGAAPSLANTYQVTLNGVAPPAVGALLLGSGDKALAGRVTAVSAMGAQTRVTLQLVPIDELFASLKIDEVFDLSRAEVLVPPEVAAEFNVARSGNTWTFTPKQQPSGLERMRPLNVTASRNIWPFGTCDATVFGLDDIRNLLINIESPSFSITLSPTLDLHYDRLSGLTRFIVGAEPLVKMGVTLRVSIPLKGEVKCSRELFQLRLPIGGPLAFFFGGTVPVGVGFKLEAEAALATFKVGAQTEFGTKLSVGWNCPGPKCEFVHSMETPSVRFTPVFDPLDPIQLARLAPKLHVFGSMDVELGNPFLRALRFKGFEFKLGPALKGNFAPPAEQIRDAAYKSDYSSAIKGGVKLGVNIDDILAQLGLTGRLRVSLLDLEHELASSPKALKIEADRTTFGRGDTVNIKVTLDPATLNFLGLYNVESVQLRRLLLLGSMVLATQTASPGQQVFDFSVSAPTGGNVSEWTAFVTTWLVPLELTSLELGPVVGVGVPSVSVSLAGRLPPGTDQPMVVTVLDGLGQPLPGAVVSARATGGSASGGTTGNDGVLRATARIDPGAAELSVLLTITASDGTPIATRTVTALPAPYSVRVDFPAFLPAEVERALSVTVLDGLGQPVPGAVVSTLSTGGRATGGSTDASGVMSGTARLDAGAAQLVVEMTITAPGVGLIDTRTLVARPTPPVGVSTQDPLFPSASGPLFVGGLGSIFLGGWGSRYGVPVNLSSACAAVTLTAWAGTHLDPNPGLQRLRLTGSLTTIVPGGCSLSLALPVVVIGHLNIVADLRGASLEEYRTDDPSYRQLLRDYRDSGSVTLKPLPFYYYVRRSQGVSEPEPFDIDLVFSRALP